MLISNVSWLKSEASALLCCSGNCLHNVCVWHEINWLHWEWLHLTNVRREQKQVSVTAPVHLSEEGCACVWHTHCGAPALRFIPEFRQQPCILMWWKPGLQGILGMGGGEGYSHYNIFTHIHKQVHKMHTHTERFYDFHRKGITVRFQISIIQNHVWNSK